MAIYFLGNTPLLAWLINSSKGKTEKFPSKQTAFEDDLNGIGSLKNLKRWRDLLEQEGGKFGSSNMLNFVGRLGRQDK